MLSVSIMLQKEQKKKKIIRAAAAIFTRDGIEKARVEDIAREARIGKGTIYLYFKSKDRIIEEGIRYFANVRINKLRIMLKKYNSAIDKLYVLMNLSTKISEENPDMFFMNYAALLSPRQNFQERAVYEFFIQYVELVREILEEGVIEGVFRKFNAKVVALSIIFTQDLSSLIHLNSEYEIRNETIAKELIKLIKK